MIHGSSRRRAARAGGGAIVVLMALLSETAASQAPRQEPAAPGEAAGLEFIDTSFENASPLWYDVVDDVVRLHLIYDHERASPNRAAGHIHFRIHDSLTTTPSRHPATLDGTASTLAIEKQPENNLTDTPGRSPHTVS